MLSTVMQVVVVGMIRVWQCDLVALRHFRSACKRAGHQSGTRIHASQNARDAGIPLSLVGVDGSKNA